MRVIVILAMVMALEACSIPTAAVRSQVISYDDAIEDITNKLLVLNILRAKDKAPLHFDEIPSIHESIQASASINANYPFGAKSTTSRSFSPGLSLQVSPSFEIDHLDTKDFVTGLASPIDPKFVKYWLDRGLDRRVVLLLFFSSADIVETDSQGVAHTIHIANSPRDAIDGLRIQADLSGTNISTEGRCDAQSSFQHYLKLINALDSFTAHSYTERRLLAEHVLVDPKAGLKDLDTLASMDSSKFQWFREASGTFSVYAISSEPKTALCFANAPITTAGSSANHHDACIQSTVDLSDLGSVSSRIERTPLSAPPVAKREKQSEYCAQYNRFVTSRISGDAAGPARAQVELRLVIRSVGEIIQYLGDLLEYQRELAEFQQDHPSVQMKLNNPVTFGYCADTPNGGERAGCADVFFNLRHDTCNARFTLTYRGSQYSVPNFNPPDRSESDGSSCPSGNVGLFGAKDHTLEVLSVVHQLVDLHKSAQDIRETPYVQVLP
jgi:hypothetical protein